MKFSELFSLVGGKESTNQLFEWLDKSQSQRANLRGLVGSSHAVIASLAFNRSSKSFLCILPDKESAAYFFNDVENLLGEAQMSYESRSVFFFPATYKKPYELEHIDNANLLLRAEVINRLASFTSKALVVTYPEAIGEMILPKEEIGKNLLEATLGELLSVDFFLDLLVEYDFERVEFVAEPGQFSLRGGIIDVFSYSNDYPFRIEVSGDSVSSLRLFDPATQLSINKVDKVHILPNINKLANESKKREFLLESMPANTVVWCENMEWVATKLDSGFHKLSHNTRTILSETNYLEPKEMFISGNGFKERLLNCKLVEWNASPLEKDYNLVLNFAFRPQMSFNKNFDLIARHLEENSVQGIRNIILSDNPKQLSRIENILESIKLQQKSGYHHLQYEGLPLSLHEGFVDAHSQLAFFTDHQLFDRYHRFKVRDKFTGKQAMTIKDFGSLKPGDFVTHIDHGIGIYSGLEKIEVNGKIQESIRLIYKDNDVLYISIHALHRISRYSSKDGTAPSLHRLGSNTWANLKNKTKNKLKDIARDLIELYAKRRSQDGFAFSADTYLQNELEASFIYEDTPDQEKATRDVKKDMEAPYPMDRLLCGDVGFGKTEIAIRAAFKAVNDSKQVAILVPTTILALQHFYTFSERLKDLPCRVDYINRFRSNSEKKQVLTDLQNGKIDIIIGTHRILSKDVQFKNLGLLVIDEEQKFGVSSKEKLKQLKVNVDTLTLTATPIPRTLQFSMLGARDLSLIHTPPPNRYPISTELHVFDEALIQEAINFEVARGGQVFFIHNRVENIMSVAAMIQRLCPDVTVAVGHGQMDGDKLENIMVEFINGQADVLVSTTIVESGLDIPNANTIIINNAHYFGLSDLHQMRGRVGRTNKKAFCYLLTPTLGNVTDQARKRLKTLEEFSELGSGFNIAMRDLDIRGAGNLLGAEQSGFIADIGLETFQKILDEAISELKEKEFKELYAESDNASSYSSGDCQLETDLELMIPSDYVSSTEERLNLYKEIDSLQDALAMDVFASQMADRFGPLPPAVEGLLKAVKLRWEARLAGFEKIVLKGKIMIGYFISKKDSDYFDSPAFRKIIEFVQANHRRCSLKETNDRLSITIKNVTTVDQALQLLNTIKQMSMSDAVTAR